MIAYDLKCHKGHQFEAWFRNGKAFESQRKRGLIECPRCGSSRTEMVFKARAIRKTGHSGQASPPEAPSAARLEKFLKDNFEDVGRGFADEARKVHYGEREPANLRGETTADEEAGLREEGIGFIKVALPKPTN